ncbi:MAG: PHP domain-containing protein [Thermoplasmata archaeon]|nr:PHP domain-containing protein [Thermoplasmata archaeon]
MMNFHIHTTWSDGIYTPEIIVREAIKRKMEKIAITDHYQTRKVSSVPKKYLKMYVEDIQTLRKKYRDIEIYIGIEVDFSPRTDIDKLPSFEEFDFILFEYVQDSLWEGYPLWMLLDIRKKIESPVILAHNDLLRNFRNSDIHALLRVLEADKIGIELNTNLNYTKLGDFYYRLAAPIFERVRDFQIPISVGSDLHEELDLLDEVDDALSFIQELHLEKNLKLFLKEIGKRYEG